LKTEKTHKIVVEALEELKALNIISIDVRKVTTLTDYFIITTGTSNRHRKAIADEVEDKMNEGGFETISKEGYKTANWILLDFGFVVVNIFDKEIRSKFNLEKLWSDGILSDIRNKKEG